MNRVIESMPAIIQSLPNAVYLIVGDGPERKRLEQLSSQLGMSEYVVFVGSVQGSGLLNEYYNLCDQFIMISRELAKGDAEGFGIVLFRGSKRRNPCNCRQFRRGRRELCLTGSPAYWSILSLP